jgi:sigma-B regulation protein RsbU (phosphoserine phosphatase)
MRTAAPGDVLSAVSDAVQLDQRDTADAKHCTAILAMLEPGNDQLDLHLANGGHPPALLVSPRGVESLQPSGPILGWMPGLSYPDTRCRLRHGEVLVLYTDGITDARRSGALLGLDGLRTVLAALTEPTPANVVASLRRLLGEFDTPHQDDIAVVAIGVAKA